jgi:calcium permeable stress-gated cation channel
MIFFVYATIAPISTVALGLTFFILSISFRHQFVYIYPRHPDTGGKMFVGFINFAFTCIIVSELTVVGFLGIKQNPVAAGLMFPLIVVTIGFMIYIKQKHMSHGNQLPSSVCMEADYRNAVEGSIDFSFIKNAYLHPALKAELDVKPEEANMLGAKAVNQTAPSKELSEDSNTGRGDEVNQDEVA